MKRAKFYRRVAELLSQGRSFVIAYLVQTTGSAPQQVGARLLVHRDGTPEFTIGGGALEALAIEEALEALERNEAGIKDYKLKDLGMYCGGAVRIFYDVLSGSRAEAEFYRRVHERLAGGKRSVIAHLIGTGVGNGKLLISADGMEAALGGEKIPLELQDSINHEARALLSAGGRSASGRYLYYSGVELFLELVEEAPRLLIFGAGHIGAKLAQLAAVTGLFQVEVVDDRAEFLDQVKPFADRVYKAERGYRGKLPLPDGRSFVAIVTHSHQTDKAVLQQLLGQGQPPVYLGMIGSVNKRRELFRMLREEGITDEQLEGVRIPIGLPLGGKDPGEIAVSILAEIIKIKNMGER